MIPGNIFMTSILRAIVLLILLLIVPPLGAGETKPVKPGSGDKCPVCGMFVAKYPDWIAEIVFSDGSAVFFDGVKDMLKYYFNLQKYNPRKTQADIRSIFVMDYYTVDFIDGRKAFYVSGSDTYGPMGKELIPFEKETQAQEFLKDHKGKAILTFGEIDAGVVKGLD
jgi:copper chaperone NosL